MYHHFDTLDASKSFVESGMTVEEVAQAMARGYARDLMKAENEFQKRVSDLEVQMVGELGKIRVEIANLRVEEMLRWAIFTGIATIVALIVFMKFFV